MSNLLSQKQAQSKKDKSHTEPAPTPRLTTQESVTLASGEKRTVEIEATNDPEWDDLVALAEGGAELSLDQKDITHRTFAAILTLRFKHKSEWKPYCMRREMKWPREVKSQFQPLVMWLLNRMKAKTGENHTSKASMIAGCLDDIWQYEMTGINGETNEPIDPLRPDNIPAWLDIHGGYTTIYRRRLERKKEPADKREEQYRTFLNLPPLEQRDIPDWLGGFDGDVVIAAHINHATGKIDYRSVWQPEGSAFWHRRLKQFIAARPDYGEAVEPVRMQAEPMFDFDDREAKAEHSVRSNSQEQGAPSVETDVNPINESMVEEGGEAKIADLVVAEATDPDDTEAFAPEGNYSDLGEAASLQTEPQSKSEVTEVGSEATTWGHTGYRSLQPPEGILRLQHLQGTGPMCGSSEEP